MGCSGTEVIEREKEIKASSLLSSGIINKNALDDDLMTILYTKINKLIKVNPFYDISLKDFQKTINELNLKIINENYFDNDNIIDEIISKYFQPEKIFVKVLFKNFVKYSISKFYGILPIKDNDIIILILYFLYIFLSKIQPGKKNLFKEKIKVLLNKTKYDINKENENQFKLSLLSNLLINFIQMFSFCFGSFFLFFTLLDNFDNYNKDSFEELINNNNIIKEVKSILDDNLSMFNQNMSPYYLNLLVISEINNKINYLFEKVGKNEEFILLNDDEINDISESLFDTINIKNYVDYLFFGENREY